MTTNRSSNHGTVAIRRLREGDAEFAATLHRDALPHGFFVALGMPFLRSYYGAFVNSPEAVALLASCDDAPAGILVGTVDDGAHYRFIVRRWWWRLLPWAFLGLVAHPSLATRFLRTRARRYARGFVRLARRTTPAAPAGATRAEAPTPAGVLTHLAVTAQSRGAGVGAALVSAYVDEARSRGARRLRTVTLADEQGAGAFYERVGWQAGPERADLDGRLWSTYTLDP